MMKCIIGTVLVSSVTGILVYYMKINNILKIKLNIVSGITRITQMNEKYKTIKHMSFDYVDNFYEIHGSHRNRVKI